MENHYGAVAEIAGELEAKIDYKFGDVSLLYRALTHKSFANEHPGIKEDNQRLEFLGDAVLGLVVAEALMERLVEASEGELTPRRASLVNEASLARRARGIDLGSYLLLGKGEEKNQGRLRPSILADAVEAVVGAVYLDGGYSAARHAVTALLGDDLENAAAGHMPGDPKTLLQELLQARAMAAPDYRVVDEQGPDHQKIFEVEIVVDGEPLARASGRSKKEAEKAAAKVALAVLEERQ